MEWKQAGFYQRILGVLITSKHTPHHHHHHQPMNKPRSPWLFGYNVWPLDQVLRAVVTDLLYFIFQLCKLFYPFSPCSFFFLHFFGCWGQDPLYTDIYKERCGASISKYPHVYIFEIRFFDLYIILISLPDSSYMLLCPILPSVTQTACDDVKSPTTLFWKYAILVEINLLFFYY